MTLYGNSLDTGRCGENLGVDISQVRLAYEAASDAYAVEARVIVLPLISDLYSEAAIQHASAYALLGTAMDILPELREAQKQADIAYDTWEAAKELMYSGHSPERRAAMNAAETSYDAASRVVGEYCTEYNTRVLAAMLVAASAYETSKVAKLSASAHHVQG